MTGNGNNNDYIFIMVAIGVSDLQDSEMILKMGEQKEWV